MKNLSFLFVAALSLAAFGCKKKGADCSAAINHSMDLSKAEMSKAPGMDDKMMAKMKDVGIQHCKDDKWPDDVVKCMTDAKTEADAQACYGKLTKDQQDKMNKAAMDMATGGGAGGGGSAGGAMGSDTGSAAAGSAAAGSGSAAAGSDTAGSAAGSAAGSGSAGSAAAPK